MRVFGEGPTASFTNASSPHPGLMPPLSSHCRDEVTNGYAIAFAPVTSVLEPTERALEQILFGASHKESRRWPSAVGAEIAVPGAAAPVLLEQVARRTVFVALYAGGS